jgi:predicted nuclease of predicted toxin-antitoxin system
MSSSPPSNALRQFLVDENMPRPLAPALIAAGYDAEDVRDAGLRSHPDSQVWAYAQAHHRTIITFDGGFGDIRVYTPPHAGIIVAEHIETVSPATQVQLILDAVASLAGQSLVNAVVTVSPGRVRVRR